MPRYKPTEQNGLLLPVILSEQIQPGSFEFALDHLIEHELDLSDLDARFNNDETSASAYNPRAMLKIVLLAYSRGLTSSRRIAQACEHNIQFIAMSGDARPSYTHIAKFVRQLGPQIQEVFSQVLITCDRMQLIGRQMFAIDGVKLGASHEWLDRGANVLLFGPPGVGKSHLISGLGHALIDPGRRVLFSRCSELVQRLQAARRDLRLA